MGRSGAAVAMPMRPAQVRAVAEALAEHVLATAANRDAAERLAPVLPNILAGMVAGAAQSGKAGFSDRSMMAKMLGLPWATGSEQQRSGKTSAAELGSRLERALNRNTAALRGQPPPVDGPVIEGQVEEDGPTADTAAAATLLDLGF
jgi:hypothetical protein